MDGRTSVFVGQGNGTKRFAQNLDSQVADFSDLISLRYMHELKRHTSPKVFKKLKISGNYWLIQASRWNEVMRVVRTPVGLPRDLQISLDGTPYIHAVEARAAAAFLHTGAAVGGDCLELTRANFSGWYGTHTAHRSKRNPVLFSNLPCGQRH